MTFLFEKYLVFYLLVELKWDYCESNKSWWTLFYLFSCFLLLLVIESADNFEQSVDATVVFYLSLGNMQRKMKVLDIAAIRETWLRIFSGILAMDVIKCQRETLCVALVCLVCVVFAWLSLWLIGACLLVCLLLLLNFFIIFFFFFWCLLVFQSLQPA